MGLTYGRRLIETVSNQDTMWASLSMDLCDSQTTGHKREGAPLRVEPGATGLNCQCSVTDLRCPPSTSLLVP